jgi:hypothetical protein
MEQRKYARYPVGYVGAFSGERVSAPGVIVDLSTAGCRARSATEFNKGEYVETCINVPRFEHPLHVPLAVIRWSNGQEFGMEFIQMAPNDQQRLRDLIRATESARALQTEHVDEGIQQ